MMTVAELIREVLDYIRRGFYSGRVREFLRDQRALTKAIARYGYACDERGWDFSVPDLQAELHGILIRVLEHRADIRYLPVYLEGAVDRHVRCRAEELSLRARRVGVVAPEIVSRLRVQRVRDPKPVEILAAVYRDLRRRRRRKTPEPKTGQLL
jgi:hypothetical protein